MVSPLTGCKEQELIYINTKKLDLVVMGKPCHPKAGVVDKSGPASQLSVKCIEDFFVDIKLSHQEELENNRIGEAKYKTTPLFFENQNYQFIIENKGENDITFWHENITIREKINAIGRTKRTLSGVVNFGSEIGFSEFKIIVDGKIYLEACIEIFPSKIDYANDYIAILNDVNNEIYNLAFDFLKKTYLWSNVRETTGNSLTEFFSIIQIIFEKLMIACDTVLKSPHHILQQEKQVAPFHKLHRSNTDTIKWLQKRPQNLMKMDEVYVPSRALTIKKNICFDTFENRFIKYILKAIIKKLQSVRINYTKLGRKTNEEIINYIDSMKKEINKKLEFSFLRGVGDLYTLNSLSLVLNMAPGYKDIYKYYLMLIKGLSLDGEVFKISIKDLAVLYEYWCFIKLNGLLKNKYKLIKQDLIKIDSTGLFVTLCKGKKATVTYENPQNGEKFTISYNNSINKLPTVSQRPDNILSLEKHGSKTKYEYIFDAKYRINNALEGTSYRDTYKQPGPEEDDINTMHRYRDAIVQDVLQKPDFERTMFGAYILFPYGDIENYRNHKFYESIEKVNIGGLPFLPNATKLVEELLEELIEESPETSFERTVLPKGSYEYINNVNFIDRDVLVGTLRNVEQLDICLENRFYHIPCSEIAESRLPLRYVALYQSSSKFKNSAGVNYYGEIILSEKVRRRDITEIPSYKNGEALYYKFYIKEWKKLNCVIKPRELRVSSRIYTNLFLILNSEYVTELCIKTKEEYRLYMELKRLTNQLEIDAHPSNVDEWSINLEFEEGIIYVEGNLIKVYKNQRYKEFELQNFALKPRNVISFIRKFMNED